MTKAPSQMSPLNSMPDQNTFLHVKQRLDYHYLPSDFPIQATHLLQKLLEKLDKQHEKQNYLSQPQPLSFTNANSNQPNDNIATQAVRHQMSKVIQENNQLHAEIITLKEEVFVLKHAATKAEINRQNGNNEVNLLNLYNRQRETKLFEELQDVKYKYNQLMDLVHSQESKIEKEFIKRLLKHKHYKFENIEQSNENEDGQEYLRHNGLNDEARLSHTRNKRGVTLNERRASSSNRKNSNLNKRTAENNFDIDLLREKLSNREREIKRLQSKLQFDGLNMNRILKNFQDQKGKEANQKLHEKIRHLEKENKAVGDQIAKIKRQGGDKQALRQECQKNHDLIKKLTLQNNKLKQQNKQICFDEKKSKSNIARKLNSTQKQMTSLAKAKMSEQSKLQVMKRNNEVLENRANQLQQDLRAERQKNKKLQQKVQNLIKQTDDRQILNEYEKNRMLQLQSQNELKNLGNQRQLNELRILSSKQARENQLLKEAINTSQKIQEELMRKNNTLTDSTFGGWDRTVVQEQQQYSDLQKQEIAQLRKLLSTEGLKMDKISQENQRQNLLLERYKKQCQILKEQNRILSKMSNQATVGAQMATQLRMENASLKDTIQVQKERSIKLQSQNQQLEYGFEKAARQSQNFKDQFQLLKKSQKQTHSNLRIQIASLEESLNIQSLKNEEKQLRIKNIQAQLIECSEKLRDSHRQLNQLDESLHSLNIEKSRLERKYQELVAESNVLKERQEKNSVVKEIQLKSDIEKLCRESQNNKLLQKELQQQVSQLLDSKLALERELRASDEEKANLRRQMSCYREKEQLYEIQIVQLKRLANL